MDGAQSTSARVAGPGPDLLGLRERRRARQRSSECVRRGHGRERQRRRCRARHRRHGSFVQLRSPRESRLRATGARIELHVGREIRGRGLGLVAQLAHDRARAALGMAEVQGQRRPRGRRPLRLQRRAPDLRLRRWELSNGRGGRIDSLLGAVPDHGRTLLPPAGRRRLRALLSEPGPETVGGSASRWRDPRARHPRDSDRSAAH